MNSKKSPHESSLQVISRIESENVSVFSELSISDIFYVERCLDEKIKSLAIDPNSVDLVKLASEIEHFKLQKKETEATIVKCKQLQDDLCKYSQIIEENGVKLQDMQRQKKEQQLLKALKEVMC
jgi:Trk K+ transport system NAD-binding subunit